MSIDDFFLTFSLLNKDIYSKYMHFTDEALKIHENICNPIYFFRPILL